MPKIMVNLAGLSGKISVLNGYKKVLNDEYEKIEQIERDLMSKHTVFVYHLEQSFNRIRDNIITESTEMECISETLQYIVQEYEKCEKELLVYQSAADTIEPSSENEDDWNFDIEIQLPGFGRGLLPPLDIPPFPVLDPTDLLNHSTESLQDYIIGICVDDLDNELLQVSDPNEGVH